MDNFEEYVAGKFQTLNNSQNSIQSTAAWVISNKFRAKEVVKIWFSEFRRATPKKKLTFLYLANDVIQNGRKKAPQFSEVFHAVLQPAFKETAKVGDKKTRESLNRLLKIWRERNIYPKDYLEKVKNSMAKYLNKEKERASTKIPEIVEKNAVTLHASHRDPRIKPTVRQPVAPVAESISENIQNTKDSTPVKVIPTLDDKTVSQISKEKVDSSDLLRLLEAIQNPPSIDEVTRRTIASFPAEVSDPQNVPKIKYRPEALTLLDKVKNADVMLIDYNNKLTTEMKNRKELSHQLKDWLSHQTDALKSIDNKLQVYKDKLEKAKLAREALNSHLSNLPQLNLTNETDSDLNPLPSLDELFN